VEIKYIGVLITTPYRKYWNNQPLERANEHVKYKALLTEYLINAEI